MFPPHHSCIWQVYSGGLAGGGDHHEGLLQSGAARDHRLCGPLSEPALSAQGPAAAAGHRLHGDQHTVSWHTPQRRPVNAVFVLS